MFLFLLKEIKVSFRKQKNKKVNLQQVQNLWALQAVVCSFIWAIGERTNIMRKNDLFQRYYCKLICKIFVAGHSSQGENVIVVLYGDEEIIYSCVVDSFILNDRILPKDLLYAIGINHITDLFWTHPHDDHSNGILDLIEEFKPEAVYISSELHTLPFDRASISSQVLEGINKYKGYDRRFSYQPKIQGIATNSTLYSEILHVGSYNVPFEIFTIAPSSGKVRRNAIENRFSALNDYSIVISINIGDFSLLLTGDVQNRMIAYANEDLYREVPTPNILKIPHHGSNDSVDIMKLFSNDQPVDIAITTSKRTSNLPRNEAMQYYNSHCHNIFKINPESEEVAVWGVEVNILEATITQIVNKNF